MPSFTFNQELYRNPAFKPNLEMRHSSIPLEFFQYLHRATFPFVNASLPTRQARTICALVYFHSLVVVLPLQSSPELEFHLGAPRDHLKHASRLSPFQRLWLALVKVWVVMVGP